MQIRYGLRVNLVLVLTGFLSLAVCTTAKRSLAQHTAAHPARTQPSLDIASGSPADSSAGVITDTRPVIACFGDSLTAGYGIESAASYPADLQHLLDTAGYHYRVVNAGVSGDTTKDGLERIRRLLAQKPQIVVLEFGGNDGLRGLPIEGTQKNLATMIEQLQHGGARVALAGISLPAQYGSDYITHFNSMYPVLAKQFHVPLLPFILQDVYGVDGDIQSDGVHPTAQGAKQVAANVERLIHPMLKK